MLIQVSKAETTMEDSVRQRDGKALNGSIELHDKITDSPDKGSNKTQNKRVEKEAKPTTCTRLHESCITCCIPCLKSHHPLPETPSKSQRLRHAFMLPPNGNLAFYVQFVVVCIQIWIVLYAFTKGEALPGGNFFSLLILFVCCAVGGYLMSFIHLPPLLGKICVILV